MSVTYRTQTVDECEVFYREAGPRDAPILLLLHGFPTAGHMFRDLIPLLSGRYRVIAPDLPGFGNTIAPARGAFDYSFDNLALIIGRFVEALGIDRYALYIFDYGAPVGLRLAMAHPERVTAIISQNGNAYIEGLSDAWGPWQRYWREPTQANREACRISLAPDTITEWQYRDGTDPSLVSPDGYTLDIAYMARPDADEIQLDLVLDYRTNVALYPDFQLYLRTHRPPLLAVWGRNDRHFLPAGAEAYRRDVPDAEIHLLDTGHFALETHAAEIGRLILTFLGRTIGASADQVSALPFAATLDRLVEAIGRAGMTIFARIDHAAAARAVGLAMPPATVLIYGSPVRGTPIMLAAPRAALDLPLRVLVREDPQGRAIVEYHPVSQTLLEAGVPGSLAGRLDPAQSLLQDAIRHG